MTNSNPTSSLSSVGKNRINNNTVQFSTSTSTANILGSLIYCGNNGYGILSPSISCNNLNRGYQGFVFDGPNTGALWAGNTMTVPMSRGLVLDHAGVIGTQGSNAFASANIWSGVWTATAGNFGTYIGASSSATTSNLWVKVYTGGYVTYPPSNTGGTVSPGQYYGYSYNTFTSTGGDYTCSQNANNRSWQIPDENDYESADLYYISKFALYNYLHFNDSLTSNDNDLADFYNTESSGSIGRFVEIEAKLYRGDHASSYSLIEEIEPSNNIESNYKDYYLLYLAYATNNFIHTNSTDSSNLATLALLCPGLNGACVYQARGLYNYVYKKIINDSECESMGAARQNAVAKSNSNFWDIKLYPNPSKNFVTIESNQKVSNLIVKIKDLSGRLIINEKVEPSNLIFNLDFRLINGVYLVSFISDTNEMIVKKLIIAD